MPVDVLTEIEISVPRAAAAAFAADPDNATTWYENIKSVEWETDPPLAVGSRIAFVASFLGRRLAYTYEIREFVPGRRLVMSTEDGPFPMETTYEWSDQGEAATGMTLRNRGEPAGFGRVTAPVMVKAMRRANLKDLQKLKRVLEDAGAPMSESELLVADVDGVRTLTLNRPEKRNALSVELRRLIAAALSDLDTDQTGAVVITGSGSAFCSGMDTTQFGGDRANREELVESSLACMGAVGECPVPTIAAVNGPAVAGGFVISLACDIRIAEPTAVFGFPELPRGIPPSFAWARAALPAALARDLCITGRLVDGDAAVAEGVVRELVGQDQSLHRARELAVEIAGRPRRAILETKRRILLERSEHYGFLFSDEEQMFREALLS